MKKVIRLTESDLARSVKDIPTVLRRQSNELQYL